MVEVDSPESLDLDWGAVHVGNEEDNPLPTRHVRGGNHVDSHRDHGVDNRDHVEGDSRDVVRVRVGSLDGGNLGPGRRGEDNLCDYSHSRRGSRNIPAGSGDNCSGEGRVLEAVVVVGIVVVAVDTVVAVDIVVAVVDIAGGAQARAIRLLPHPLQLAVRLRQLLRWPQTEVALAVRLWRLPSPYSALVIAFPSLDLFRVGLALAFPCRPSVFYGAWTHSTNNRTGFLELKDQTSICISDHTCADSGIAYNNPGRAEVQDQPD